MKVCVSSKLPEALALRRRFDIEQCEVVEREAELTIRENFFHNPVPGVVKDGFFGEASGEATHFVTRYWDRVWHPQTAIGVPLRGLLPEGMGADCYCGCSIRFGEDVRNDLFEHEHFGEMLRITRELDQTPWKGFVTFVLRDEKVLWVEKSVPFHGLFSILEGVTTRRSIFLQNVMEHEFKKNWFYTSLLLSKAPWPHQVQTKKQAFVEGITQRIEQHFWAFTTKIERYGFYTWLDEIGVATAWSDTLSDSVYRADRTCRNITVPQKQFRTDAYKTFTQQWDYVQKLL